MTKIKKGNQSMCFIALECDLSEAHERPHLYDLFTLIGLHANEVIVFILITQ